jgi:hypothetical protein
MPGLKQPRQDIPTNYTGQHRSGQTTEQIHEDDEDGEGQPRATFIGTRRARGSEPSGRWYECEHGMMLRISE